MSKEKKAVPVTKPEIPKLPPKTKGEVKGQVPR